MINQSSLHFAIMNRLVRIGKAPSIDELAIQFEVSRDTVVKRLLVLEKGHGVVLHPRSREVWVMHPFSTSPTNYCLRSGNQTWWSNCAWCSLGAAHLINGNVTVTSTFGAEGEPFEFTVENGSINCGDWYIHFPIPMKHAWDNVIFTCSMMQTFKSLEAVSEWCSRHQTLQGDVQAMKHIFKFAKAWYGNHLSKTWQKWTVKEAAEIFEKFNLGGRIWFLQSNEGKF